MKKTVVVGLALLPLLVATALRPNGHQARPAAPIEPAAWRFQPDFSAAQRDFAPVSGKPDSFQTGSVHASLLAGVEAETDPDRLDEALQRVVDFVSDEDLPAMLDSLKLQTSPAAGELRELLLRRWAEKNPAAAAGWLAQLPENAADPALFAQVAIAWAGTNLTAAADWTLALPDRQDKQAATLALAYEAARTEPIAALELARNLPADSDRDNLLVHAVSQWAAADAAAAAGWAEQDSDPMLRQSLLATVAVALGKQDGAAAATFAANALDPGALQDRAAVAIAQRWAQSAPQDAAAWVAQFPAGAARDAATENLQALQWARPVKPGE